MRFLIFGLILVLSFSLACCGGRFNSGYILELPQVPETWASLLGKPHWRVEWLDPAGRKQTADIPPGKNIEIELPVTWTNPVTAWPYWPEAGLPPGIFKPAGALFPFDVYTEHLRLTWKGGLDAVFYWELAIACGDSSRTGSPRTPASFDWPRFRGLFETDALNEAVRKDPWLADWRSIAEKTVDSGFDRRRLAPGIRQSKDIPVSSGPWYGASPFAEPLRFTEGETPVFQVHDHIDVWICEEGILRCNRKTWIFESKR